MEGNMLSQFLPHVTELDMGCDKPVKYAIWTPWPTHISKEGIPYFLGKARYYTKLAAEKALERTIKSYCERYITEAGR